MLSQKFEWLFYLNFLSVKGFTLFRKTFQTKFIWGASGSIVQSKIHIVTHVILWKMCTLFLVHNSKHICKASEPKYE